MINKIWTIILFSFLSLFSANAQINAFVNDEGETMVITKDSVFLRLNNHDCFQSYSVYYGKYYSLKPDSAKSMSIKLGENGFLSSSFSVSTYKDSVVSNVFIIEDIDGKPIDFAEVSFYNDDNVLLLRSFSDLNGLVSGPGLLSPQFLTVTINYLGLQWRRKINFDHTSNYLCRCTVPYSFIPLRKGTKVMIKKQDNSVTIIYNRRKFRMVRQ